MNPVWNDKSISLCPKIRLMRSHVTSIFLGACESWTLTAEPQRRKLAMEMRCYRKILRISYKDHVTKEEVRAKIQQAIGPHEDLLTIVKRCRLQWYGHVSRSSGLAKTILHRTQIHPLQVCSVRGVDPLNLLVRSVFTRKKNFVLSANLKKWKSFPCRLCFVPN